MDKYWQKQLDSLWKNAQKRHLQQLQLRPKTELLWFWRTLNFFFRICTLGKGVDLLHGNYYTLFFRWTIWLPGDGSKHEKMPAYLKYTILSHEIDHLDWIHFKDRDARCKDLSELKQYGLISRMFHFWKYLFWPAPFLCARYREKVELSGHHRNLEQHVNAYKGKCKSWFRKWLVLQFSGPAYGWMSSRKRAEKQIDLLIQKAEYDYLKSSSIMPKTSTEDL